MPLPSLPHLSRLLTTLPKTPLHTTLSVAPAPSTPPSPPLAILHGLLASSATYASLIRRPDFAPSSPRLALDLPCHGRSPVGSLTYASMAATVAAALAGKADVVGHSMGGKVGMALALLRPELVRKLVVVDIAPVDYGSAPTMRVPEICVRAMQSLGRGRMGGTRADIDRRLEECGVVDASVRQFVCTNLVAAGDGWRWRCDVDAILAAMADIAAFDVDEEARFEGEVLFVAGGKSEFVGEKEKEAIFTRFPRAKIEIMPHCGHWLQAEDPKGFHELVTPFLEGK